MRRVFKHLKFHTVRIQFHIDQGVVLGAKDFGKDTGLQ